MIKVVRTDRELECPGIDAGLRDRGAGLVLLPDGIPEDELVAATADADIILMCYTPIGARVIDNARRLKGIVILTPHLTFFTSQAMARLEADTLARCDEIIAGQPVLVRSHDPRLRAQPAGVVFG